MTDVSLTGHEFSVYTRIARMVLAEKGVAYAQIEVDPFAPLPAGYAHPFGKVPVLSHAGFHLYETSAITRYVDAEFRGRDLTPGDARAQARMVHVISVVDTYGYWPMVRDLFGQQVFAPRLGIAPDKARIAKGLRDTGPVLAALEQIAQEGAVLHGPLTLADCHLAPMIACLVAAPQGVACLARHPRLGRWWAEVSERDSMVRTDPGLP